MRTRRTWGRLLAVLAVALVAAVGFAPRAAWAEGVSTAEDLVAKLAATEGDDELTLNSDVELDATAIVSGSKTLDLNGHDITGDIDVLVSIPSGASLTIQDDSAEPGSIVGGTSQAVLVRGELTLVGGIIDSDGGQAVLVNGEGSKLAMTGGAIHGSNEALRGQWATIDVSGGVISTDRQVTEGGPLQLLATDATLSGDARVEGYYGVTLYNITRDGDVDNDPTSARSSFTMNGGTIDCYVFAISGNNLKSATCSAIINSGIITAEDTAIYWPMEGALTVNGGSITGGNAIEAKMGTIKIKGGTLRGTVEPGFAYSGNGSASDGSAIKVVGQLYGGSEGQFINNPSLTVNIAGGTLESASGNAVTVYVDNVESAYGGGDLTATVNVSADATLVPAEGNDGLRATSVGDFTLTETGAETGNTTINNPELAAAAVVATGKTQTSANTSKGGNTLYTSVERAIASATSADVVPDGGATITLLRDVEEDVTVPKGASVTLNLGEHTLTGSVENNGSLALAGTGEIVGQVTGNNPTGGEGVKVTVARIDGQSYPTIEAALVAAQPGQKVTLVTDVELSQRLAISASSITLDLNGHTVSAADGFSATGEHGDQLVSIDGAKGVTVKNGTIEAGRMNKHALNVWNSTGVILESLTIDHSWATGGAPLVVGASEATVKGELDVTAGPNSWYGVNVDSRMVGNTATPASLTFADGASLVVSGMPNKPWGIYMENTATVAKDQISVSFGEGTDISSTIDGFIPVVVAPAADVTVENPENAGIGMGTDGTFHVHQGTLHKAVAPTCTEDGTVAYYECDDCGKRFSDQDMTQELTSIVDPAKGHNVAGAKHVEYKAPTATEEGTREHWICPDCGSLFYDAQLKHEITAADAVVIPPSEEPVELFTVTFKFGTGEKDLVIQVPEGQTVYAPKNPTFDGYTFLAWYSDEALTEKYDFSQPVTGDLTLYAGWLKDGVDGGSDADVVKPADDKPATDAEKTDGLAQTGDVVSFLPAVVAGAAGIAAAAGALTLRRRSK